LRKYLSIALFKKVVKAVKNEHLFGKNSLSDASASMFFKEEKICYRIVPKVITRNRVAKTYVGEKVSFLKGFTVKGLS